MKHRGKYMAQRQALFGLNIGYGRTIKAAFRKANINPKHDEYGLFTVRNDEIIRILPNGHAF